MRNVTLCLLQREGEVCLGMKKRGFGEGKWNGFGGKVAEGESIEAAAIRELAEEAGVSVEEEHLERIGEIDFHFLDKPDWDQRMHVFAIRTWEGEPTESEEMLPRWYTHEGIPYDDMWIDDKHWLPHALAGKKLKAEFAFNKGGDELAHHQITFL